MPYSDFQADAKGGYNSKWAGSALEVFLQNEDDANDVIIGGVSSLNFTEDYEVVPIEETGEEGLNEQAMGRHSGNGSISGFWTPQLNDKLPTRQSFIGKRYTLFRRVAEGRGTYEGSVTDVLSSVVISQVGNAQAARGAITVNLSFSFLRRYSGQQYALLTGT